MKVAAVGVAIVAALLAGCTSTAKLSRPYHGGKMPYCPGVWITQDSRTWYCISHEAFERWKKRNSL